MCQVSLNILTKQHYIISYEHAFVDLVYRIINSKLVSVINWAFEL